MKKVALSSLLFLGFGIFSLVGLSIFSRFQAPVRSQHLTDLPSCPDKPNCVSTLNSGMDPLIFYSSASQAVKSLEQVIQEMGGQLQKNENGVGWATFETPIFRFIDDVEFLVVEDEKVIHLRSASRVGYSDMGKNQARVNAIQQRFSAIQ